MRPEAKKQESDDLPLPTSFSTIPGSGRHHAAAQGAQCSARWRLCPSSSDPHPRPRYLCSSEFILQCYQFLLLKLFFLTTCFTNSASFSFIQCQLQIQFPRNTVKFLRNATMSPRNWVQTNQQLYTITWENSREILGQKLDEKGRERANSDTIADCLHKSCFLVMGEKNGYNWPVWLGSLCLPREHVSAPLRYTLTFQPKNKGF